MVFGVSKVSTTYLYLRLSTLRMLLDMFPYNRPLNIFKGTSLYIVL